MKAIFLVAVLVGVFFQSLYSQTPSYDRDNRDTLVLIVATPPAGSFSSTVKVEAWVYSDEIILAFSAGFKWSHPQMHLDSARGSQLLTSSQCGLYLYHFDHLDSSNLNQIFQLGGLSYGNGIPGESSSKRLWATYYFNFENWDELDSISIDLLPSNEIEFSFVTEGSTYPLGFEPYYSAPLFFPGIVTSIDDNEAPLPSHYTLYQNFPNPFNPETTIEFDLPQSSKISLDIYNILGQKVRNLADKHFSAGQHSVRWDSNSDQGQPVPSGIYFYKLVTSEHSVSRKMVLVR